MATNPRINEPTLVRQWIHEVGRVESLYPAAEANVQVEKWSNRAVQGAHLRIDDAGRLLLFQANIQRETIMGMFPGDRRGLESGETAFLLNGDGFTGTATAVQTRLRERVHRLYGQRRTMVIPFMALSAAEVNYESVRPIHISLDRREMNYRVFTPPPLTATQLRDGALGRAPYNWTNTNRHLGTEPARSGSYRGVWNHRNWVGEWWIDRGLYRAATLGRSPETTELRWRVEWQPPHAQRDLHIVQRRNGEWCVAFNVHRLGATVFSALGSDGIRHRYLSAFDSDEPTPMYFLAQLPDEGEVKDYRSAIRLLAPPVVHRAWAEGREVHRQGDIFAIETDMTDEEIEKDAVVTRRGAVLNVAGGNAIPKLKPFVSYDRARAAISIYRTGHTAAVVAVKSNGATFVKGTMFHDPMLEEAGRRREHRNISLGDKWFLCVRNTVPQATAIVREEERDAIAEAA